MKLLTQEQISSFPIAHFSPSSIMCLMSDPQQFVRRYIRLEYSNSKWSAALEGTVFHAILAEYRQDVMDKNASHFNTYCTDVRWTMEGFIEDDDTIYDFKKTWSLEKSVSSVERALGFYYDNLDVLNYDEKIIAVEAWETMTGRDLDNNPLPIPFKGYTDLILMEWDELTIVDHKLVGKFTTEVSPHYIIQSCAYFFTFREKYWVDPKRAIFDEVKKSKNKDGSPQINRCVVEFTKLNLHIFLEIYARCLRMLSWQPMFDLWQSYVLPNPFWIYQDIWWWDDFVEEVREKYKDVLDK